MGRGDYYVWYSTVLKVAVPQMTSMMILNGMLLTALRRSHRSRVTTLFLTSIHAHR